MWGCPQWRGVHIMEVSMKKRCPYCGGVHNGEVSIVEVSIKKRCKCGGVHKEEV